MSEAEVENAASGGGSAIRYTMYAAGGLAIVIALIFLAGLGLAIFANPEPMASRVGLVRDVFIIVLGLETLLIVIAFAGLIIQLVRLVALFQSEVKPILQNTRETVDTAKGTAQFIGKNVAGSVVGFSAFVAGLSKFIRELAGIRRAIRPRKNRKGSKNV